MFIITKKRIFRNIKKNILTYLPAILLTLITVSFFLVFTTAGYTYHREVNRHLSDDLVEDAQFTTKIPISSTEFRDLEDKFHLYLREMQYIDCDVQGVTLRVFSDTYFLNRQFPLDGTSFIQDETKVLISKKYSMEHHIKKGEQIKLLGNAYRVDGIIVKPDYILPIKDITQNTFSSKNFGIAVVAPAVLEKMEHKNSYYVVNYNKKNEASFQKYLVKRYRMKNYIPAASNPRIQYPATLGSKILTFTYSVIPVLLLLIVLTVSISFQKVLKKELCQIGALIAQGYHKGELYKHYFLYGIFLSLISSFMGILVSLLICKPVCLALGRKLEPLGFHVTIPMPFILVSILIPALIDGIIVFLFVHRELKQPTVSLISK